MQAPAIPAIGADVSRNIPAAAAQVGDEHGPPGKPAVRGGQSAGKDMLLMAVDYVGAAQLGEELERYRIGALTARIPGAAEHYYAQAIPGLAPVMAAKGNQRRGRDPRHMAGQFVYIALRAADDAVVGIEQRRH